MGCLTFETAVENKSLAAFSLFVISGDSPLIAFTGVNSESFFAFLRLFIEWYIRIYFIGIYFSIVQISHTFSFEYSGVIFISSGKYEHFRKRYSSFSTESHCMEFYSEIIHVLSRTISFRSNLSGDLSYFVLSRASNDRH